MNQCRHEHFQLQSVANCHEMSQERLDLVGCLLFPLPERFASVAGAQSLMGLGFSTVDEWAARTFSSPTSIDAFPGTLCVVETSCCWIVLGFSSSFAVKAVGPPNTDSSNPRSNSSSSRGPAGNLNFNVVEYTHIT